METTFFSSLINARMKGAYKCAYILAMSLPTMMMDTTVDKEKVVLVVVASGNRLSCPVPTPCQLF